MATKYPHASITPYGSIRLPTNSYWFLEADKDDFGGPEMKELAKHVQILEVLDDDSRNWRMIAIHAVGESEIPKDLARIVGTAQKQPAGVDLADIKVDMYGGEMLKPVSLFEWFATNYPAGLQTAIDVGEGVKEVGSGIGFGFGAVAAAGIGLFLALNLLRKGK